MSNTVRHWKRSYQCDHRGRSASSALLLALLCAGEKVDEQTVAVMTVDLMEFSKTMREDRVYRLVGKWWH